MKRQLATSSQKKRKEKIICAVGYTIKTENKKVSRSSSVKSSPDCPA
jgi:hypothetical protein